MKQFSAYQTDIFNFVTNESGSGLVAATAGSGKTTTLVEIANRMVSDPKFAGKDMLLAAFNKSIAEELTSRLPGEFTCKTLHAHGMGAITKNVSRRLKVDTYKYSNLIRDHIEGTYKIDRKSSDFYPILNMAQKLLDMVQVNLTDYTSQEAILLVADKYDIEIKFEQVSMILNLVTSALTKGLLQVKDGLISFGDMVWAPTILGMTPKQYDFLMIDEAQDLNRAQLMLVKNSMKPGGRALFVGDRSQAIYGFAGADAKSLNNIKSEFAATEMPLSICYRCPTSHIALAQEVDPTIESAPGAIEGQVLELSLELLNKHVQVGDMILCRTTAPLVKVCYSLIKDGIPATVRGQDIGKGLAKMAEEVFKKLPVFNGTAYYASVETYLQVESAKIRAKFQDNKDKAELLVSNLQDRLEVLNVIYDSTSPANIKDLTTSILSMFSDNTSPVMLSTVHRAKGLECDHVFILKPELMPHPLAKGAAQQEGEMAIKFVALTRARKTLTFITA